jgi:hypothetical protein
LAAPRVDRKATAFHVFMPQPIAQGARRNAVDRQPSARPRAATVEPVGAMTLRRLRLAARRA